MKKVSMLIVVVVISIVALSSFVLLNDEASTATEDGTYSYTYGDYTVRQISVSVDGNSITAEYELRVANTSEISKYHVKYGKYATDSIDLYLNGQNIGVTFADGMSRDNLVIPPKVVVSEGGNSNEYHLQRLYGATVAVTQPTYLPGTKTLVISSERGLSVSNGMVVVAMADLESLVINARLNYSNQFIRACGSLSNVTITELGSPTTNTQLCFINQITKCQEKIDVSIGTTANSVLGQMNVNKAGIPVHLTLLPGSEKANYMDLRNVSKIRLDRGDWNEGIGVNDLAATVYGVSEGLEMEYYGTAPKYNVGVASDATGVAVDPSSASKGENVTITLTPDQGKKVGSVTVIGAGGAEVQATADAQNPNIYTFRMPASDVTVSASFVDVVSVSITPVQSKIAKGQSTAVTVSAVGLKDVNSIFIELNYDGSVFELGSSQYSDQLNTGKVLGKDNGRYTVAFKPEVNVDGELLTFQLGSKAQAAAGTYKISCTLEINGDRDKGSEATYTSESNITVGALIGDLNSDGVVDESDAVYLLFHTFRPKEYMIPEGQEQLMNFFEKDGGSVNSDDAIWLKEHLSNLEESLSSGGA